MLTKAEERLCHHKKALFWSQAIDRQNSYKITQGCHFKQKAGDEEWVGLPGAAKPRGRRNYTTKQTQLSVGFSVLIPRLLFPMPIRKRTKRAVLEKQNNAMAF